METLAAGKPMILSGYLPGQEEGNVKFVGKAASAYCAARHPKLWRRCARGWMGIPPNWGDEEKTRNALPVPRRRSRWCR